MHNAVNDHLIDLLVRARCAKCSSRWFRTDAPRLQHAPSSLKCYSFLSHDCAVVSLGAVPSGLGQTL